MNCFLSTSCWASEHSCSTEPHLAFSKYITKKIFLVWVFHMREINITFSRQELWKWQLIEISCWLNTHKTTLDVINFSGSVTQVQFWKYSSIRSKIVYIIDECVDIHGRQSQADLCESFSTHPKDMLNSNFSCVTK